jgi:hypothetical protein
MELGPTHESRPLGSGAGDVAGDLMPQRQRAFHPQAIGPRDVEIGVAHPGARHLDQDLGAARLGDRQLIESQWLAGGVRPDSEHRSGA